MKFSSSWIVFVIALYDFCEDDCMFFGLCRHLNLFYLLWGQQFTLTQRNRNLHKEKRLGSVVLTYVFPVASPISKRVYCIPFKNNAEVQSFVFEIPFHKTSLVLFC